MHVIHPIAKVDSDAQTRHRLAGRARIGVSEQALYYIDWVNDKGAIRHPFIGPVRGLFLSHVDKYRR